MTCMQRDFDIGQSVMAKNAHTGHNGYQGMDSKMIGL